MAQNVKPIILNLGSGSDKYPDMINVDAHGDPDVRWNLNETPYPWEDNSVDGIIAKHVFEHLPNWWGAFCECARILKPGGQLEIRVPDESSSTALTFMDHVKVFGPNSFYGVQGYSNGTNAFASEMINSIPLTLNQYYKIPFPRYYWMRRWPFRWLLVFCSNHLRNFIHEQTFIFVKTG